MLKNKTGHFFISKPSQNPTSTDQELNRRSDPLSLTEDIVGNSTRLLSTGISFLNRTLTVQVSKPKIRKWDLVKLKVSVQQRTRSLKKISCLQNGGKKILYASHRELVSILHKELKNLNINKQTKQNRNDNNPA